MNALKSLLTGGLCLLLAACATTSQPRDNKALVQGRAQERLDLMLAGQYLKAYDYLSPGYRSSVSPEQYIINMGTRSVTWSRAQVEEISCEVENCSVSIKIDYSVNVGMRGIKGFEHFQLASETWIYTASEWWYVPK